MIKFKFILCLFAGGLLAGRSHAAQGEIFLAHGHVPEVVSRLKATGELPPGRQLQLAIGLPLRNPEELEHLLARLYDPTTSDYRRFLTPQEFTARFAPTENDYEMVVRFAETNHLHITARHGNRLLLDVSGSVRDVNQAFHIQLRTFHHPTQNRDFFAPQTEPTVSATLPILDVSGFSDLTPPHSRLIKRPAVLDSSAAPRNGSAGGAYLGNDFRAAYVPGTILDGAGQMIGLVQFDGFYSNDIVAYANQAGVSVVPLQTVLLDGFNGVPTTGANSGNGEVSLDVEMAIAMAPALSKIIIYEAGPGGIPNDVLNTMAVANAARQLSCSWGWGGGPSATTDQIFQQMAAQGQSFFLASGDSDAFTAGANSLNGVDNSSLANAPSDSPYLTVVGGTTLTTSGPGGAWISETTWNWGPTGGKYVGSSGGISSYYPLPVWQQSVGMATNGGSITFRNVPDVALTADNVFVVYGNGVTGNFGGTSCAAPLWAGFMALVNQQASAYGLSPIGFLNPAIYALGKSADYATDFHDVVTGSNAWPSSPDLFYATGGYDLCTGWGTPTGSSLIDALAPQPDALGISPSSGFNITGAFGGGFSPNVFNLLLTNTGTAFLTWSAGNLPVWLNLSPSGGNILPGTAVVVTASLSAAATNLPPGSYLAAVLFTNLNSSLVQNRLFSLQVTEPLLVNPANGFAASGLVGGPFNVSSQIFSITNAGGKSFDWSVINPSPWLDVSPSDGTLAPGGQTFVTASLNFAASNLAAGNYSATVLFSNGLTGGGQSRVFTLQTSALVQNGGFETGDFTGWTRSGNGTYTSITTGGSYAHAGIYGLRIGPTNSLGFLAQTLPTVAGQSYFVSFWLDNSKAGTPNEFKVTWDGNVFFDQFNLTALGWTNLHFLATASTAGTILQFGFRHDPAYFGFDDVSVTPVPTPAIRSLAKINSALQLTWNTMVGLIYQVQYRTNLVQGNWQNLGASFTANSFTQTISDPAADTQRYYRIVVLP